MKSTSTLISASVVCLGDITPTVREFTLQLPTPVTPWQPGAHVQVHLASPRSAGAIPIIRHYSLLPSAQLDQIRIAVKLAQPSRGGSLAMWNLQLGDNLNVSDPLNHFSLDLNCPSYLLVAGGIGITPLLSMAALLRKRGAKVRMIYAARSSDEWAFGDELENLLGDQLELIEGSGMDADKAIAGLPAQGQAYVCGPSGLLGAMQKAWSRARRKEALLRFETFGATDASNVPFEVHMPRHSRQFEVKPELSLLDAIEAQGIAALSGCRRGECGLCALPVLSLNGEIEHRDVFFSDHEKRSNAQICVCVSRVRGSITLDSTYRPDVARSA